MEITDCTEQENCTMFTVRNDAGELIAHAVPHGVAEARIAEWDLPADVDPMDVILVQAHLHKGAGDADPYGDWYEEKRGLVLAEVRKQRGKIQWAKGVSRAAASEACRLPPGLSEDMVAARKAMGKKARAERGTSMLQRLADRGRATSDVAAGYERIREERQGNDHVAALNKTESRTKLEQRDNRKVRVE